MLKNKLWAYVYMPFFLVLSVSAILFILIKPFTESASLLVNAVTTDQPGKKDRPASLFDSTKEVTEADQNKPLPSSDVTYPTFGTEYGLVIIDNSNVQAKLIYGDSSEDLRVGVGHFNGSVFPGEAGTTLIGGHNTSDLAALNNTNIGDTVTIKTHYGNYQYEIKNKEVRRFDDKEAIASLYKKSEKNQLILYTCYPIDMVGLTNDRLFVYADLIKGRMIDPTS